MGTAEGSPPNPNGAPSQRWTNALLIVATVAAVSGVLALLFRPQADPGIEVSLPTPTPPPMLMVYLSGAVAQPGVYEFQPGDRLQDLIGSAGGLQANADASAVNMATLLEDEQHYHFPLVGETMSDTNGVTDAPAARHPSSATEFAPPSPDNPVNINSASLGHLQSLPGIGVVKAEAIIDFRKAHGPFGETSEITSVPGIGPTTLENIRHLITVAPTAP